MGVWGNIRSAVSGATSSVRKHSTALARPAQVVASIDPRTILQAKKSGRLPGASMLPGAAALLPGMGLTLKDRIRVASGDPKATAKALVTAAASSPSSRYAPHGLAKGLGPQVSNIASVARANLGMQGKGGVRLARWF